mgnify:CR=1 FL=1
MEDSYDEDKLGRKDKEKSAGLRSLVLVLTVGHGSSWPMKFYLLSNVCNTDKL